MNGGFQTAACAGKLVTLASSCACDCFPLSKPLSSHVVIGDDSNSVIAFLNAFSGLHRKEWRISETRSVCKRQDFFQSFPVLRAIQIKHRRSIDLIFRKNFSPALLVEFYRRITDY